MGRKGKNNTEDPQDEGGANEVIDSTKPQVENEEEKNGAEGKFFQCFCDGKIWTTRSRHH